MKEIFLGDFIIMKEIYGRSLIIPFNYLILHCKAVNYTLTAGKITSPPAIQLRKQLKVMERLFFPKVHTCA